MASEVWPSEDGWPYPDEDGEGDIADPLSGIDEDTLLTRAEEHLLLDRLGPLEREVLIARFGLEGHKPCSMREVQLATGLSRHEVRLAVSSGLAKLRSAMA
ncbi:MAG: hypothetical protein M1115_01565 [Actinobacteria bacterium]|nr:hypothetical protein [Actinomycetota bacterium]